MTDNYDKLFKDYLKVCNDAIEKNKDSFPYGKMMDIGELVIGGKDINIAVYDDRPKEVYSLKYESDKFKLQPNKKPESDKSWHVSYSYLKKVVDNPEEYIKNPVKLDWDWLKSKVVGQ